MSSFVMVNKLQAKAGQRDELIAFLRELGQSIHAEPDGVHYSVHTPIDDPDGPVTVIQAYSSVNGFREHGAWMEPHIPKLVELLAAPPAPPVLLEQVSLSGHLRESFAA